MSNYIATTCEEAVFQYCNYGYDKTKYTSREDCLDKKTKEDCGTKNTSSEPMITCNDGTQEYPFPGTPSFQPIPCENHGGVKVNSGGGIPAAEANSNANCESVLGVGGLFQFHCWQKDAKILSLVGLVAFSGYGIYTKKTPIKIIGLGLLGVLSGLVVTSIKPKN